MSAEANNEHSATAAFEPVVSFAVIAKVESAPGGDVQHMLHLKIGVTWDGQESADAPAFAIAVNRRVFESYELGDILSGRLSV